MSHRKLKYIFYEERSDDNTIMMFAGCDDVGDYLGYIRGLLATSTGHDYLHRISKSHSTGENHDD